MRLLKVKAPAGKGSDIIQTAFSVGVKKASLHQVTAHSNDGTSNTRDVVDIETSTPKGKRFVEALLKSDCYNAQDYALSVRSALSIVSDESARDIAYPLPDTPTDILQELYQFSHVTYGFVGRIFVAAILLAYGMINQQLLIMIAGLLFLPLLPLLQAIGFGAWSGRWKLCLQGLAALTTALALLIFGGLLVAILNGPPLKFDEFSSLPVGFLISLAVGVAAGLALIDDTGKREMIGLAASSQTALIPVWLGICLVFGFPKPKHEEEIIMRFVGFFVNVLTLTIAALAVHALTGTADGALAEVRDK